MSSNHFLRIEREEKAGAKHYVVHTTAPQFSMELSPDRDAPDKMEPAERAKLLEDWQHRDAAFAMLNWYRASPIDIPPLDAPYEVPEGWAPPPYPALRIPTLVIWAQDDLALPAENTDELDQHVDALKPEISVR